METAFLALLSGSAAVSALAPLARINWGTHPQGAPLPALVLNVISDRDNSLHQQGTGGLWRARVQVDCYGQTYTSALGLADAVTRTLHGRRQQDLRLVTLDGRRDNHETGAADRPFRVGLDFIVHYRRA